MEYTLIKDCAGITRRDVIKFGGVIALGGMSLAALSGCASGTPGTTSETTPAPKNVSFTKPGTYTAVAAGRHGEVALSVRVGATAIEAVTYKSLETLTIGGQAMDLLTERVLSNQTVSVDAIAGATFSSVAYMKALRDCIEQAGGEGVTDGITEAPVEYVTEADVVVVGAGGAGLAAALTAAQAGSSVILLEKSDLMGGNSNAAMAGINVVGSDVQRRLGATGTVEEYEAAQMNNDLAREDLVDALAASSGETADWFADLGVVFTVDTSRPFMLRAESENANTTNTLVQALCDNIVGNESINLYKRVEVKTLVTDESGAVTGVTALNAMGKEITFKGKSIVLALGGFGQNHDLVTLYNPKLENASSDEIAPTTGDGLFMAAEIGAALIDLNEMNLHARFIPHYGMLYTGDQPGGRATPAGIFVNNSGKRVASETQYPQDVMLAQDQGASFHIFPASAANKTIEAMLATKCAHEATSASELAAAIGVDASGLKATIDSWNADIAAGTADPFGRTDAGVLPLDGSIMAYEFHLAVHYCLGGVLIDDEARVLDLKSGIINGLYAAGEVTGGLHGTTRVDGSAIADTFVFGRIAGKTAVAAAH
jgi:flavocytochrome c